MQREWARFGSFLKRPRLPDAYAPVHVGMTGTMRMLMLDLILMLALVMFAGLLAAIGIELPRPMLADRDFGWRLILLVVIIAPVVEEVLFRSWLSGRPGAITSVIVLVGGVSFFLIINRNVNAGIEQGLEFLAVAVIAFIIAFVFRKRRPMGWFQTLFPVFFWLSTLVFALAHLLNFKVGTTVLVWLLVIPQFITGAILAYLRVSYGLWSCILLHGIHNAIFVTIFLLTKG